MVLEEAAGVPDVYRDDSSPTSDVDPYSGTLVEKSYDIDLGKLPSPIPIIGPLLGYTAANLSRNIGASILTIGNVVKRPLTDDEVQALAFHAAKAAAIASWGLPVGAAGGLWRASNTRSTYRFPFWQPDLEKFNPKKLGPLTGTRAEFGWQYLRRFAYAAFGGWLGKVIIGTYAATVAATGTHLDSRMKDIVQTLKTIGNEEARKRTRAAGSFRGGSNTGDSDNRDSSPSSASAEPEKQARDRITGSNTGVFSDSQIQKEETRQQAQYSRSGGKEDRVAVMSQPDERTSRRGDFDFDDASPTSGNDVTSETGEMTAWERLRKGRSQTPSQPQDGRMAQSGRTADSFSFSKSDEERQLAKAQAQKEFDERLEQERKGRDFDDDRRWR